MNELLNIWVNEWLPVVEGGGGVVKWKGLLVDE